MAPQPPIPPDLVRQYERERARILRRRALVYCGAALGLLALSLGMAALELAHVVADEDPLETVIESFGDGVLVLIHVAGAVFLVRGALERRRVVAIISWMIALTGTTVVLMTPLVDNSSIIAGATTSGTSPAVLRQGLATLTAVFVMHAAASMLVSLSPREGLRPLVPVLVLFAATTLIQTSASLGVRLGLIALAPLAGLPGLLFSWWRHRSFFERFQSRWMMRRYQEVERDLADARRVHEALLPAPVRDGPFRLDYCYQPARQIGGDFLFVRCGGGSLSAALIDVTGHGTAAALAVNRLHAELERLLADGGGQPPAPGEVVRALNAYVASSLAGQRLYATAVAVRAVARGNGTPAVLEWCNAGHPDALLRRSGGAVERLGSTTCMLGALEPARLDPAQRATTLAPGDVLLLVTDGVTEARDARGAQLGREGVTAWLGQLRRLDDPARDLMEALDHRRDGAGDDDDVLIVALRSALTPPLPSAR